MSTRTVWGVERQAGGGALGKCREHALVRPMHVLNFAFESAAWVPFPLGHHALPSSLVLIAWQPFHLAVPAPRGNSDALQLGPLPHVFVPHHEVVVSHPCNFTAPPPLRPSHFVEHEDSEMMWCATAWMAFPPSLPPSLCSSLPPSVAPSLPL